MMKREKKISRRSVLKSLVIAGLSLCGLVPGKAECQQQENERIPRYRFCDGTRLSKEECIRIHEMWKRWQSLTPPKIKARSYFVPIVDGKEVYVDWRFSDTGGTIICYWP